MGTGVSGFPCAYSLLHEGRIYACFGEVGKLMVVGDPATGILTFQRTTSQK